MADTTPDSGADSEPAGVIAPVWGTADSLPDTPGGHGSDDPDTRPATGPDTASDRGSGGGRVVLSGRVVATGPDARPALPVRARRTATIARRRVAAVARHERTQTGARAVARNVVYVPAGALVVSRRSMRPGPRPGMSG